MCKKNDWEVILLYFTILTILFNNIWNGWSFLDLK